MSRAAWVPALRALPIRLRRAADRLGNPGLIGAAILAACVGYYAGSIQPLAQQIDALQIARATGQHPASRALGSDAGDKLRQFAASFPEERELAQLLTRLYALGEREGVRLAQGEYRFVEPDALGMVQYKILLPVSGPYPRIRHFIVAVLADAPWMAVTQVNLQRERIGHGRIDARLELTLHLRAAGAAVAQGGVAAERVSVAVEASR